MDDKKYLLLLLDLSRSEKRIYQIVTELELNCIKLLLKLEKDNEEFWLRGLDGEIYKLKNIILQKEFLLDESQSSLIKHVDEEIVDYIPAKSFVNEMWDRLYDQRYMMGMLSSQELCYTKVSNDVTLEKMTKIKSKELNRDLILLSEFYVTYDSSDFDRLVYVMANGKEI